jgi:hypothetical protein
MARGGKITRNSVASAIVAATLLFALLLWRRDAAPRLERATGALSPPVGMFNPVTGTVTPGQPRAASPAVGPAIVPPPAPDARRALEQSMSGAKIPLETEWQNGEVAPDAGIRQRLP